MALVRRAKDSSDSGETSWHGLKVLLVFILLLFIPLIASCMWAIVKDPVTPHLFLELWFRARELCCARSVKSKRKKSSSTSTAAERKRRRNAAYDVDEFEREAALWAASFEPGFAAGGEVVDAPTPYATPRGGAGGAAPPAPRP